MTQEQHNALLKQLLGKNLKANPEVCGLFYSDNIESYQRLFYFFLNCTSILIQKKKWDFNDFFFTGY